MVYIQNSIYLFILPSYSSLKFYFNYAIFSYSSIFYLLLSCSHPIFIIVCPIILFSHIQIEFIFRVQPVFKYFGLLLILFKYFLTLPHCYMNLTNSSQQTKSFLLSLRIIFYLAYPKHFN